MLLPSINFATHTLPRRNILQHIRVSDKRESMADNSALHSQRSDNTEESSEGNDERSVKRPRRGVTFFGPFVLLGGIKPVPQPSQNTKTSGPDNDNHEEEEYQPMILIEKEVTRTRLRGKGEALQRACSVAGELGFGCSMVEHVDCDQLASAMLKVLSSLFELARRHDWCNDALNLSNREYRRNLKRHEFPWTDMEFFMEKANCSLLQPSLVKKVATARLLETHMATSPSCWEDVSPVETIRMKKQKEWENCPKSSTFYSAVYKAYVVQAVATTLHFPISCLEGRYIHACRDVCKSLDIFMSVMRIHAAESWECLMSFNESDFSLLSKQKMDLLYLGKKTWNAVVVFWSTHMALSNSRCLSCKLKAPVDREESYYNRMLHHQHQYLHPLTMDTVKRALESVIADLDKGYHRLFKVLSKGMSHPTNMENEEAVLGDFQMEKGDYDASYSFKGDVEVGDDGVEAFLSVRLKERLQRLHKAIVLLMEKDGNDVAEDLSPEWFQKKKEVLGFGCGGANTNTFFSLHDIHLLGHIVQSQLGMQFWQEFVFGALRDQRHHNKDSKYMPFLASPSSEECDDWLEVYLANSMNPGRFHTSIPMMHGCEPLLSDVMHGFHPESMYASSLWTPSHGNQLSSVVFGLAPTQTVIASPNAVRILSPGVMKSTFKQHFYSAYASMVVDNMVQMVDVSAGEEQDGGGGCDEEQECELAAEQKKGLLFFMPSMICLLQNVENLADLPGKHAIQQMLDSHIVTQILTNQGCDKGRNGKVSFKTMKEVIQNLHALCVQVYELALVGSAQKYQLLAETEATWEALEGNFDAVMMSLSHRMSNGTPIQDAARQMVEAFVSFFMGMDELVHFVNDGITKTRRMGMTNVVEASSVSYGR